MAPDAKIKKVFGLSPEFYNSGFYLITPLLLGVFIGFWLDRHFNTKPVFIIAGIVLGTISVFYNLWKLTKEVDK